MHARRTYSCSDKVCECHQRSDWRERFDERFVIEPEMRMSDMEAHSNDIKGFIEAEREKVREECDYFKNYTKGYTAGRKKALAETKEIRENVRREVATIVEEMISAKADEFNKEPTILTCAVLVNLKSDITARIKDNHTEASK
jgi:hypothetical protein